MESEAKHGEMTLCRFDGDNGEYSLLLGNAKGVEGPYTKGTYVWVEVKNLKRLEQRLWKDRTFITVWGPQRCGSGALRDLQVYRCDAGSLR